VAKPGPAPWAFSDTSALIGPPVRPDFSAIAAIDSGSNAPALEPAGNAWPSFHSTASTGMSQICAARDLSCSTTFSAACVAAMPVAKVTRLPPVTWVKPIDTVSPTTVRTISAGTPSTSATIMPIEARDPPISGLPDTATTVPSSATCTAADDSPPMLNQKPEATPRPWNLPNFVR
jgi:hypothetical protein